MSSKNVLLDPSHQGNRDYGEMTTPTGAAILASLASFDSPVFSVDVASYGAGNKDFDDIPNVIGLWIGETDSDVEIGEVSLLETNIDDMSPEFEDCRKIAEETQLPLSDVYRIVEQECREYLGII